MGGGGPILLDAPASTSFPRKEEESLDPSMAFFNLCRAEQLVKNFDKSLRGRGGVTEREVESGHWTGDMEVTESCCRMKEAREREV